MTNSASSIAGNTDGVAQPRQSCSKCKSSLAQADVRPLDALVIDGEECEAKKLLLVDLLGGLHCLLVVDVRATWIVGRDIHCANITFSRERWIRVFEPLDLLSTEELPDRVPFCVV